VIEIGLLVIAVLGLVLAAVMAGVAWRLSRAERRRSAARVATLAAGLREAESFRAAAVGGRRTEPRLQPISPRKFDADAPDRQFSFDSTPDLFRFESSRSAESRLGPVLTIGVCALVVALALILTIGRATRPLIKATAASPASPASRSLGGPASVELVALGQERDGDRLTVRGAVRNPLAGERFDRLMAVITFFDRDGKVLATARAPVQPATLPPGAQSTFALTVARAQDVGRYRVRFHVDERIVAHVDRRADNPSHSFEAAPKP
jgi:hypothetical protein